MLNQCILTGNLGGDPEVFYSSEGNPVASFSLAFHSSKKKTGWIKLVCFQKLAEVTQKYLHKGARIAVIGTLDHHKWETDEGIQKSTFQLIANSLEFIVETIRDGTETGPEGTWTILEGTGKWKGIKGGGKAWFSGRGKAQTPSTAQRRVRMKGTYEVPK